MSGDGTLDSLQYDLVHRWQAALSVLVECESPDRQDVFRAATRSVAAMLGYRYAGIGILRPDSMVRLECFWDGSGYRPPYTYRAEGTPCYNVYGGGGDHCCFDRVAERFPQDVGLRRIGAELYRGMLIRSEDGDVIGHIFAVHDRSEDPSVDPEFLMRLIAQWCSREIRLDRMIGLLREKQEQLQDALAGAELANTAHRAFLANVSHELRTPLNAIVGFSEALALNQFAKNTETVKDYGQFIGQSARHLLALINNILDIASIESGHLKLRLQRVDVETLAQEVTALTSQVAARKEVEVRQAVDANAAEVHADELGTRQILINLVSNALKNTGPGGSVVIGTHRAGERIALFVRDTGIGIPQEAIGRILQPFQRIETGFSRQDEGTGLGLSIVSRLTDAMQGHLTIDSEPGVGTTVTVTLPAAE